jgi:hypothetical protein
MLTFLEDSSAPMFKDMVSPTFIHNSSYSFFSLLPTSLDENELSRGVKPRKHARGKRQLEGRTTRAHVREDLMTVGLGFW